MTLFTLKFFAYRQNIIKIFLYALAGIFIVQLSACSIVPARGMRYKALADVMDDYMRTKDSAWLIDNIGEPDEKSTEYKDYSIWLWKKSYTLTKNIRDLKSCEQFFIIENRSNKISGWQTDCAPNTMHKMYGEIAATTPIPKAVIPESLFIEHREAQAIAKEKAEAARTRTATLADWLFSLVGQREEKAYTALGEPSRSETLSNGKMIKTYSKTWEESHFDQSDYLDWADGVGSVIGGTSYTNESCSYSVSFKKGMVIGYDGGSCDRYPYYKGKQIPFKTPQAPWKAL